MKLISDKGTGTIDRRHYRERTCPRSWKGVMMDAPAGVSVWDWFLTRTRVEQIGLEEIIYYHLWKQLPFSEGPLLEELEEYRKAVSAIGLPESEQRK